MKILRIVWWGILLWATLYMACLNATGVCMKLIAQARQVIQTRNHQQQQLHRSVGATVFLLCLQYDELPWKTRSTPVYIVHVGSFDSTFTLYCCHTVLKLQQHCMHRASLLLIMSSRQHLSNDDWLKDKELLCALFCAIAVHSNMHICDQILQLVDCRFRFRHTNLRVVLFLSFLC